MPRPKSDDPKVVVTLRLRASDLEKFKARRPDWRTAIEAFVRGPPEPKAEKAVGIHVDVPVYKRQEFRPNPKKPPR
jgi:hypothetical protein